MSRTVALTHFLGRSFNGRVNTSRNWTATGTISRRVKSTTTETRTQAIVCTGPSFMGGLLESVRNGKVSNSANAIRPPHLLMKSRNLAANPRKNSPHELPMYLLPRRFSRLFRVAQTPSPRQARSVRDLSPYAQLLRVIYNSQYQRLGVCISVTGKS